MKSESPAQAPEHNGEYGSTGFIIKWTLLVMGGLCVEFVGRFFGYVDNPLSLYHPVVSALVGILAIAVVLAGLFALRKGQMTNQAMTKRTGVMMFVCGGTMLIGFFLFRFIIPQIFG
jgi:hypothetical protein